METQTVTKNKNAVTTSSDNADSIIRSGTVMKNIGLVVFYFSLLGVLLFFTESGVDIIKNSLSEGGVWIFLIFFPIVSNIILIIIIIIYIKQIIVSVKLFKINQKKLAWNNLVPPLLIVLLLTGMFLYSKSQNISTQNYNREYATVKYFELQKLFEKPGKIIEFSPNEFIILVEETGQAIDIVPIVSEDDLVNFNKEDWFNENSLFLSFRYRSQLFEKLKNKEVTVKLPSQEYFLNHYCCYASDDEYIDYSNYIVIRAYVYLDSNLIDFHDYPVDNK